MIITLGFTESDQSIDYSSFSDGYRIGARQTSVTIVLEGDGRQLSAQQWAAAAFVASNHPGLAPPGPARALQIALGQQVHHPLRAVSVGDTVTVHDQMWACQPEGWRRLDGHNATGWPRHNSTPPKERPEHG